MNNFLVWVDLETSGLDLETDHILEVGITVTDLKLEPFLSAREICGFGITNRDDLSRNEFVREMHEKSGLADDLYADDKTVKDIEERLVDWLEVELIGGKVFSAEKGCLGPMCGSSVHFDHAFIDKWLPRLGNLFSYRNIDVSGIQELAKVWNPTVAESGPTKRGIHRTIEDIEDSIELLRWNAQEFLLPAIEISLPGSPGI